MVQVTPAPKSSAFRRIMKPFGFWHTYLVSLGILIPFLLPASTAFLWLHNINLILFIFLISTSGLLISLLIGYFSAKPIAISIYKNAVRKEQETYSRVYTPLAGLQDVYETPVSWREPEMEQYQKKDMSNLVESEAHLLILGLPGSGKTTVLRASLRKVLQKADKIPIYIPMKDYNAYLLNNQRTQHDLSQLQPAEALEVLFDYILNGSNIKKIDYR